MPYSVKGFFEIDEDMVQILLVLEVLFTQDSEVEDLFCGAPSVVHDFGYRFQEKYLKSSNLMDTWITYLTLHCGERIHSLQYRAERRRQR